MLMIVLTGGFRDPGRGRGRSGRGGDFLDETSTLTDTSLPKSYAIAAQRLVAPAIQTTCSSGMGSTSWESRRIVSGSYEKVGIHKAYEERRAGAEAGAGAGVMAHDWLAALRRATHLASVVY